VDFKSPRFYFKNPKSNKNLIIKRLEMFLRYVPFIMLICTLSACLSQQQNQEKSCASSGPDNNRELPVTSVTNPLNSKPLSELPEISEEESEIPEDQIREIPLGDIPMDQN